MTSKLSEDLALVAAIDALAAGTGTSTSDVVDAGKHGQVMFILNVGTIAATGTVDLDIQEGTSTTSFNTSTALASITQLGATDDNKQVIVNVDGRALTDGYRYLRAVLTRGTANSNAALVALGGRGRHNPNVDKDLASVAEIVEV